MSDKMILVLSLTMVFGLIADLVATVFLSLKGRILSNLVATFAAAVTLSLVLGSGVSEGLFACVFVFLVLYANIAVQIIHRPVPVPVCVKCNQPIDRTNGPRA